MFFIQIFLDHIVVSFSKNEKKKQLAALVEGGNELDEVTDIDFTFPKSLSIIF